MEVVQSDFPVKVALFHMPRGRVVSRQDLSRISREIVTHWVRSATGNEVVVMEKDHGPQLTWQDSAVPGVPPIVSLSYCGSTVAVALASQGKIGIDLERKEAVPENIIRRVMSNSDLCDFEDMRIEHRRRVTTLYWTCAEAVAKADGRGLFLMLSRGLTVGLGGRGSWGSLDFAAAEIEDHLVCAVAADVACDLDAALASTDIVQLVSAHGAEPYSCGGSLQVDLRATSKVSAES
jgi:hypothetical protein